MALLLTMAALASVSTTPAQAGDVNLQTGVMTSSVYNDSPFDLKYVAGWSRFGVSTLPTDVPFNDSTSFGLIGLIAAPTGPNATTCSGTFVSFEGWFTFQATLSGGMSEFITVSVHGYRGKSACEDTWPAIDVWRTSTKPPPTWRYQQGAPTNVNASSKFTYQHNSPSWLDQTIDWTGDGPGQGRESIVSLGDSTISGEGGRWAGNTNLSDSSRVDAGAQTYWDTGTGESIPDCHRSTSSEVHLGGGIASANFACSAATTYTYDWDYPQGRRFKPGVDSHCEPLASGECDPSRLGQLDHLYLYAKTHNVKAVVLAVGANDFDFSEVVKKCLELYVAERFSPSPVELTLDPCASTEIFQHAIDPAVKASIQEDIWDSLRGLTIAMTRAGYDKSQYTVILQNYWSAMPKAVDNRIPDIGTDRADDGGCPIRDVDANALNTLLLPTINNAVFWAATRFRQEPTLPKLRLLDVTDALKGHRLCEKGVSVIEDIPNFTGKGTDAAAADKVEWVAQARTLSAMVGPYTPAEGGHANYWGQLAERNCLRQLYAAITANPTSSGGKCVPATTGGVNARGEPNMTLQSLQAPYMW